MALILIILVLLQDSKGGAMGMLGGGSGNSSVFGSTGAGNFLVKATRTVAIIFAITSVGLVYMTTKRGSSVLDKLEAPVSAEKLENTLVPVDTKEANSDSPQKNDSAPVEKEQTPESTKE